MNEENEEWRTKLEASEEILQCVQSEFFPLLMAVVVYTLKLNKSHYMIYVKSWSHWIRLDSEEMKKISQKTVVEA